VIDRRTFILGLGALLPAGGARAQDKANGVATPDKKARKLRDIPYTPLEQIPNHRQFMRDIIIELSAYAKTRNPQFIIVVRNAPELLIKEQREWNWESWRDPDGAAVGRYTPLGSVNRLYLKAIDGTLIDGLFCGRQAIDQPTPEALAKPLLEEAAKLRQEGRRVLTIEYCKDKAQTTAVTKKAAGLGTLTYIDQDGDKFLGRIPGRPPQENAEHVTDLSQARNFLPILNSARYGSRDSWVSALAETNYDLLLLDPFWRGNESLTFADVKTLKYKQLGSQRLVLGSVQLGRANDTRFYWKQDWRVGNPGWIVAPDPDSISQMMVRYWDQDWKAILGQYMQGMVDLGLHGVLLDQADSYLFFEDLMPLR
jgi:endo-alpha-1,4-polygalactosaminidase (GH114 family)